MNRSSGLLELIEQILGPRGSTINVYHRTREENIPRITRGGFRIDLDRKGHYGPAVYSSYRFNSQTDPEMIRKYGEYILRCVVDIEGYIIFDKEIAQEVYGTSSDLRAQFSQYNIPITDRLSTAIDRFESTNGSKDEIVRDIMRRYTGSPWEYIPGILYDTEYDGPTCVTYDPLDVIPIAYGYSPVPGSKVQWNPVPRTLRSERFQKYAEKSPRAVYSTKDYDTSVENVKEQIHPHWIRDNGVVMVQHVSLRPSKEEILQVLGSDEIERIYGHNSKYYRLISDVRMTDDYDLKDVMGPVFNEYVHKRISYIRKEVEDLNSRGNVKIVYKLYDINSHDYDITFYMDFGVGERLARNLRDLVHGVTQRYRYKFTIDNIVRYRRPFARDQLYKFLIRSQVVEKSQRALQDWLSDLMLSFLRTSIGQ